MNPGDWFKDTVTIKTVTGYSGGKYTFSAATTIKARVEHRKKLLMDADGQELQSDHVFVTDQEIKTTDMVWLPGDDTSVSNEARRPLDIRKADTKTGSYTLWEVYL